MAKFKVKGPDGKAYVISAPDQKAAMDAYYRFIHSDVSGIAPAPPRMDATGRPIIPDSSPAAGLPIPGTVSAAEHEGRIGRTDNRHFGPSASDTMNPLPAIAAGAYNAIGQLPVIGGDLQRWRNELNAKIYGGTPEQAQADITETARQNPEASIAGKAIGAAAPYALAASNPFTAGLVGLEGSLLGRLGMTFGSQWAVNTSDNLRTKGQNPVDAARNAILPAAAATPFAALGRASRLEGERGDAVKFLQREGVPLTGGQQRGSTGLMMAESQLGGSSAIVMRDKQLSAYTKAALKTAGVNADAASPQVMDKAFTDIGNRFNTLVSMTKVRIDQQMQNDLLSAVKTYQDVTGQSLPVLDNLLTRVGTMHAQGGGIMGGAQYKALSTELAERLKGGGSPELKTALQDIKEALDDGVARSMTGQTHAAWQRTRQQYANLMRVSDAVDGAGAYAAQGLITPEALSQAIRARNPKQYVRGWGDLNQLARAGVVAMPRLPDSGTASRLAPTLAMGAGVPTAATTYALTNDAGHAALAGAGAAAGTLAPFITGRAMLSAPGRALLAKGTNAPAIAARGLAPLMFEQLTAPRSGG